MVHNSEGFHNIQVDLSAFYLYNRKDSKEE